MYIFETERLSLRTWQTSDVEPLFKINQDKAVMEFFPSVQDWQTTSTFNERMQTHFEQHGYCLYAVELKARASL